MVTVYAIYFVHRYFRDFGLSGEIRESLFSRFSDVFITINRHIEVEMFARSDSRNSQNKTTSKITTYTVFALIGKNRENRYSLYFCARGYAPTPTYIKAKV